MKQATLTSSRELSLATRLGGVPGVVPVLEGGVGIEVAPGRPFVVRPYYPETLQDVGRVPWTLATEILEKIASAVSRIHAVGVVHGDLKPSNVALDSFHQPMILDFGSAQVSEGLPPDDERHTFSLGYVAPEVLTEARVGMAADVYSLGSIYFFLLTGRSPHHTHQGEGLRDVVRRIAGEPVSYDGIPPFVPDEAVNLLVQALSANPDQRPTAIDLASALRTVLTSYEASEEIYRESIELPASSARDRRVSSDADWDLFPQEKRSRGPITGQLQARLDGVAEEQMASTWSRNVPALLGGVASVIAAGLVSLCRWPPWLLQPLHRARSLPLPRTGDGRSVIWMPIRGSCCARQRTPGDEPRSRPTR